MSKYTVHEGTQGLCHLHKPNGLAFLICGAARVMLSAFALDRSFCTRTNADEKDAKHASIKWCASLHKHLGKFNVHRQAAAADQQNALQAQKLKFVDVNDVCSYKQVDKDKVMLHQEDILLQRSIVDIY